MNKSDLAIKRAVIISNIKVVQQEIDDSQRALGRIRSQSHKHHVGINSLDGHFNRIKEGKAKLEIFNNELSALLGIEKKTGSSCDNDCAACIKAETVGGDNCPPMLRNLFV